MTALNIRKNIGALLHVTASAVEQLKVPTKQQLGEKVDEDRKSTRLNSSHVSESRMPSSA